MKTRVRHVMSWLGVCMLAVAIPSLWGCATNRVSLSDLGTVKLEIVPSKDPYVHISEADVYQDGNELVVTGTAVKRGPLFTTYKGHIDVAVISPEGETIKQASAEYRRHPSRRRTTTFAVRIPVPAEKGTIIRLMFHTLNDTDSNHPDALEPS